MDISDIRRIGKRLKEEIAAHRQELLSNVSLGKGAGGDTTHLVDKRAEDIIYEELEKLGEPLTLVSEECGYKDIKGGGIKFLADPIDGSRNAISGIPVFSTSIAVVAGDAIKDVTIGYVINLVSGDEFWALRGEGSYLNGRPIKTQEDDAPMVIAYEAQTPGTDIPKIIPLISRYHRARCFGSTALDMAFLAQGALSSMVIPSPSRSFDFAAGYLLIREAGGIVTDLKGKGIDKIAIGIERSTPLLASANETLHNKALGALKI